MRGSAAFGILASIWTDSTVVASAFIALVAFGVQLQLPVLVGLCHPGQRPAPRGAFRTDEHDGRGSAGCSRSSSSAALPTGGRAWATPAAPSGTRLFTLRGDRPDRHGPLGLINPEKTVDDKEPTPAA